VVIAIAMASHKKSRVHLSLEKEVEIIKHAQNNTGLSLRSLESLFRCGKTQIGKILNNKESIITSYKSNASGSRVHTISRLTTLSTVTSMMPSISGSFWQDLRISLSGAHSFLRKQR